MTEGLRTRGDIDLTECFINDTLVVAKKGGRVGKTKRGKGTKLMVVADFYGLPVAADVQSAATHEVTLVRVTFQTRFTSERLRRLVGDCAYDSDPLDRELAAEGVDLIAPYRSNRSKAPTQNGRCVRRYQRRWKVERLNVWLQNWNFVSHLPFAGVAPKRPVPRPCRALISSTAGITKSGCGL